MNTENNPTPNTGIAATTKKSLFKTYGPFVGILIVAGIAFGAYWYFSHKDLNSGVIGDEAVQDAQPESGTPNYTIEQVPLNIADIAPNVDRSINFGSTVPQEVRIMLEAQATPMRARLKEDPARADDWFNLAIIYHTAEDYKGAVEVWEFLTQVIPNSTTAYDNLGKTYHFALKEYPKAESYFKKSLTIDASDMNAYLGLFELYRYSYKVDTSAASDIMKNAIAQFPDRLDLVLTLGTYYAEKGDYATARVVLNGGLDKARDANDVNMIAEFGREIEKLTQ